MNDLEVLDEPNDVTGVKRAREETEAEGAPEPKFAKFDDGACLCVCMKVRANIWRALPAVRECTHSRIHSVFHSYILHTPSSSAYFLSPSLFRNCLHARIPYG